MKAHRRARLCEHGIDDPAAWEARLNEFGRRCAYCLQPLSEEVVEHMIPLSRGGTRSLDNIVPSCRRCNLLKGTRTLLEVLAGRRMVLGRPTRIDKPKPERAPYWMHIPARIDYVYERLNKQIAKESADAA
jgi:5-methylcytosine-specific restriction endonuclease McrA